MARLYTQDEVDRMLQAKDDTIKAKDETIKAKDDAFKATLEAKDKAIDDKIKTIHAMRYVWLLKNRCHVQARRTPW